MNEFEKHIELIHRSLGIPEGYKNECGLALDLTTEGCEPLTVGFDETEAFRWLQENAYSFSFRMSYPKGNKFGISYEPWHWAFN